MAKQQGKPVTLEDVLASVQGGMKPKYNFMLNDQPLQINKEQGLEGVRFAVPKSAIYDRLSDGTYVPKYENFKGAVGNEDRLAKQQSAWEQALHGVSKAVVKVGSNALDATLGTAYGIVNGISEGSWTAVWNNEVSNSIDDFNARLNSNLVNYYTDEEKSRGMLNAIPGFGAANFWFNDVADGFAFVAGALLPEIAIGALSGGATVGVSTARMATRLGGKALIRETGEQALKKGAKEVAEATAKKGMTRFVDKAKTVTGYNNYKKGADIIRQYNRAIYGKVGGDIVGTGLFLARTSNFEAGMEARHHFHDAVEKYYRDYEAVNGRKPTIQEASEFMKNAKTAANGVYSANLGILAVSNAVMFSSKFNIGIQTGKKLKNTGNRLIGLNVKHSLGGKSAMKKATKGQRLLGNSYLILGKPAVEGLYEEGFQGVAGRTMQNWLEAKYDPKYESTYDTWAALTDAFAHQYTSSEGWKEIGIGMIIGSLGGTIQGAGIAGIGKNSRKSRESRIQSQVDAMNAGQDNLISRLNSSNAVKNLGAVAQSKSDKMQPTYIENSMINKEYIQTQEAIKSRSEIRADYDAVVDNMELTDSQIEQIGEENVDAYKESLKTEFRNSMDNYTFAKKAVAAIGLDEEYVSGNKNRGVKTTDGNRVELQDALIHNIMMGKGALDGARNIAEQIDALTGSEGIFNFLEHYNNLDNKQKKDVDSLIKKKKRLEELRELSRKHGEVLANLQTKDQSQPSNKRAYQKRSSMYVTTQQQITELEQDIANTAKAIDAATRAQNFDIDGLTTFDTTDQSVLDVIENLNNLDGFIESLELSGRTADARLLNGLMEEFKSHSDAHREMVNGYHRMRNTNFFSTKEGLGLKRFILGEKYVMTDEFRKILRDNDKIIDRSLGLLGIARSKRIDQLMEEILEKNPNISDREKFRMESIIRLQLGYQAIRDKVEQATEDIEETSSNSEINSNQPLKGDTVKLRTKIDSKGDALNSAKILDKLINDIMTELDLFRKNKVARPEIEKLEKQIEELKEKKEDSQIEAKTKLLEGLKKDLEVEKAQEEVNEDMVAKLEEQISNLEKEMPEAIDEEIKLLEEELSELKSMDTERLATSEEYKRLRQLNKKNATEGLTEDELTEKEELEEAIDQWMVISGIVSNGVRLSDLIEQRDALKNTQIEEFEKVETTSTEETLKGIDIPDKSPNVHYDKAQTYDGVTAVMSEGKVEISGITWEAFVQEAGIPADSVQLNKKGEPIGWMTLNAQGNILLEAEAVEEINRIGNLVILPTNNSLLTNYSMVLKNVVDENGNTVTSVLRSNFNSDFQNPVGSRADKRTKIEPMVANAIYDMEIGDEISLEVSPEDAHNKKLLKNYKKAVNSKAKNKASMLEKALNELRKGLVIRVKNKDGKFVGVLKAKRMKGQKNAKMAALFEGLRDQVVNDEAFINGLLNIRKKRKVKIPGKITVKQVLIGHPNFNFKRAENGDISVESKPLTEVEIGKIVDIGYIQNGKPETRTKKKVDTRYMQKEAKKDKASKIPFVVVQKGKQRIAIPVQITPNEKGGLEEFETIFNSEMSLSDKAVSLNKFLASRGIDITEPGQSFYALGESHNVNDEFYSNRLARLEEIDYFSSLDSWLNPKRDMASLLQEGVSSNIDINDPVHSPKVSLDFNELEIEIDEVTDVQSASNTNSKTTSDTMQSLKDLLDSAPKKPC